MFKLLLTITLSTYFLFASTYQLEDTEDIQLGFYIENEKAYINTWRRGFTSTPENGGNTVIVGHRYADNAPGYHLYDIDKLSLGDELILYWGQKEYVYYVYNTLEVPETAIAIEDPSDKNILTLYACDWSGSNRLVVQAELTDTYTPEETLTE